MNSVSPLFINKRTHNQWVVIRFGGDIRNPDCPIQMPFACQSKYRCIQIKYYLHTVTVTKLEPLFVLGEVLNLTSEAIVVKRLEFLAKG